ncbi:MAG TPA: metalloregulator ArsR/SmtB family transcription factor [Solirubrobacterales bacterium]
MPAKASVTKTTRAERIHHPAVDSLDLATVMRALGDPLRIQIVREVDAEGEILCTELYQRLGLPASTGSYHLRQLREAGVTRARAVGTARMTSLRREDLESRFPGLVDLILR